MDPLRWHARLTVVTYDEVAYWPFDDGPGHTEAGNCADGRTCDRAPGGDYNLLVTGPAWLDAEAGLSNTVRP